MGQKKTRKPRADGAASNPEKYVDPAKEGWLHAFFQNRSIAWRAARWSAAVVLTAIGFALGFVPGVPGVPLFAIAVLLIAADFTPARRLASWFMRKFPWIRRKLPRALRKQPRPQSSRS